MNAVVAEPAAIDRLIAAELSAARDGDRDAYGRIVAGCQNTVTAVALAITRDVQASEDIAQEAFLSAWQHLRRLQNPSRFLPWLRQIARNLARDHLRALAHRPADGGRGRAGGRGRGCARSGAATAGSSTGSAAAAGAATR